MPARAPSLSSAGAAFGVSSSAYSAFDLGGGSDPTTTALQNASEYRYEIGLRYNNGQASEGEYQAAIAAELAISNSQLASTDPDVQLSARRHIAELTNLRSDIGNHAAEVQANAAGPAALLQVLQGELSQMQAGSTGYTELATRIKNLTDSIASEHDADVSREAAYELATVQNSWQAGTATDSDYKAAYAKYADAQKPGTTEYVNAQANLKDLTYRLDRNAIVQAVTDGKKSNTDLLAFDKTHLDTATDKNSQGYRDALNNYQQTQGAVFDEQRAKVDDDMQHGKMTAAQGLDWYKKALTGQFSDNPDIIKTINGHISTLNDAVQTKRDSDAVDQFNAGTMSPTDFLAYTKTRQAAFVPGTDDYDRWKGYADKARTAAVQPAILAGYNLSQQSVQLQKFIDDNSKPPTGGKSTRQQLGPDGKFHTVTVNTPPSAADQDAWKQRQAEVADAKTQLAALNRQISQSSTGFVTSQQMLTYWQQQQGKVAKGSPEWYSFQDSINGVNDRIHAEALLAAGGVKISYPGVTTGGLSASSGGGGGGGSGSGAGALAGSGGGSGGPTSTGGKGGTPSAPGGNYDRAHLADVLASETGLDYKVAYAWLTQEGVTPQSYFANRNNPLGIKNTTDTGSGYKTGVGPRSESANSPYAAYNSPEDGLRAAAWVLTHIPRYKKVLAAIKAGDPNAQMNAIIGSGWAQGHYGGSWEIPRTPPRPTGTAAYQGGTTASGSGGTTALAGGSKGNAAPKPPTGKTITANDFLNGLGKVQSNGSYNARNSKTGAFGRYQILPGDWSAWADQYLGDANAAPTPENQEKVARGQSMAMYQKLGSWDAVAYWWQTRADPAIAGDPTKWSTADQTFVTNVIHAAGGTATVAATKPPAKPTGKFAVPVSGVTAPHGQGVASGLRAIVPGTTTKDDRPGSITQQQTVGIDFPVNLDGDLFDQLYGQLHTAIFTNHAISHTFNLGDGKSVNILLPDNPIARGALVNQLDDARIQLYQDRSAASAGTDREASDQLAYGTAVKDAGVNQISLLDTEYGGKYKAGSDMAAAAAGVTSKPIARGLGAQPTGTRLTPAQLALLTPAARADYIYSDGLQHNSLNPIAAAERTTDITTNYVATLTARAQAAMDAGRTTDAMTILRQIDVAVDDHGSLVNQIAIYAAQGQAGVQAIERSTGAEAPAAVNADVEKIRQFGESIASSRGDSDKIKSTILPLLKTDSAGNPVFTVDAGGAQYTLKDDVALYVDPSSDGLKVTYKRLPGADFSDPTNPKHAVPNDPDRIPTVIPAGSPSKTVTAYASFHIGTIGFVVDAAGTQVPIRGRILDIPAPDGTPIVEDPTQVGKWAPGPITYSIPSAANLRLEPTTKADGSDDGTGRTAITFDANGHSYKLVPNEVKGTQGYGGLEVYRLDTDVTGAKVTVPMGSANLPNVKGELGKTGFGLSLKDNSLETVSYLTQPNLNGPHVQTFADANDQANHDRVGAFSRQVVDSVGKSAQFLSQLINGRVGLPTSPAETYGPPNRLNPLGFLKPPALASGIPSSATTVGAPPPPTSPAPGPAPGSVGQRYYTQPDRGLDAPMPYQPPVAAAPVLAPLRPLPSQDMLTRQTPPKPVPVPAPAAPRSAQPEKAAPKPTPKPAPVVKPVVANTELPRKITPMPVVKPPTSAPSRVNARPQ